MMLLTIKFRSYRDSDFLKIRQFLGQMWHQFGGFHNWSIVRWDFARTMAQGMHNTFDEWARTVGIWEDEDGNICAVVNSEGEERGEAFFQVSQVDLPESALTEMFTFAEQYLPVTRDGRRIVRLRIPEGDTPIEAMAKARGFELFSRSEWESRYVIAEVPEVKLPTGFSFKTGLDISAKESSQAHATAFGYLDQPIYVERSKHGCRLLREQAPGYRPDLDIYVVAPNGDIASFATMWHDSLNKTGHLEPVGTHPNYRRMGLARAAIDEGIRRVAQEGATQVLVGSTQDFYLAIGFKPTYKINIWDKVL